MEFVFDPSLVLYLPFYELDGASFKSRDTYGHLCSVTGALWRADGRYFDGADDKIVVPDHVGLRTTGSFTIGIWIYLNAIGSEYRLYSKDEAADPWEGVLFRVNSGNTVDIILNGYGQATTTATLSAERWYCLMATIDEASGLAEIDINGEPDVSAAGAQIPALSSTLDLAIGQGVRGGLVLDGLIGELIVMTRAMTFSERQNYYLATRWRYR